MNLKNLRASGAAVRALNDLADEITVILKTDQALTDDERLELNVERLELNVHLLAYRDGNELDSRALAHAADGSASGMQSLVDSREQERTGKECRIPSRAGRAVFPCCS